MNDKIVSLITHLLAVFVAFSSQERWIEANLQENKKLFFFFLQKNQKRKNDEEQPTVVDRFLLTIIDGYNHQRCHH